MDGARGIVGGILLAVLAAAFAAMIAVGPTLFPNHEHLIFWISATGLALSLLGLAALMITAPKSKPAPPDPDWLYQNGIRVAHVSVARVNPYENKIEFEGVNGGSQFNPSQPVQYRNYVLRLNYTPIELPARIAGGSPNMNVLITYLSATIEKVLPA
jgi:hypothetical protein